MYKGDERATRKRKAEWKERVKLVSLKSEASERGMTYN